MSFSRYDSTVNVGGNRAWLSKRQEVKYLTTHFDVSVVLQPSTYILLCGHGSYETMTVNVNGRRHLARYDAGGIRRKKERKQEANPKHDEKRGSEKGSRERVDRNDEAQLYEYYFPADVLDDRTSSPSSS